MASSQNPLSIFSKFACLFPLIPWVVFAQGMQGGTLQVEQRDQIQKEVDRAIQVRLAAFDHESKIELEELKQSHESESKKPESIASELKAKQTKEWDARLRSQERKRRRLEARLSGTRAKIFDHLSKNEPPPDTLWAEINK